MTEVYDYFSPTGITTCDLCGDEFSSIVSSDLLAHLKARHPKEFEEVDK